MKVRKNMNATPRQHSQKTLSYLQSNLLLLYWLRREFLSIASSVTNSFWILFLAGMGCHIPSAIPVSESPKELPAPVSVAVQRSAVVATQDPGSVIRTRLQQIGATNLLVVRARVDDRLAKRRVVPKELGWGPFPLIVTAVGLSVLESYCGTAPQKLTASYVGGSLRNGEAEYNELMERDLTVGEEHVFILRSMRGEHFLELGRVDMLKKDVDGRFVDAAGRPINIKELKNFCP